MTGMTVAEATEAYRVALRRLIEVPWRQGRRKGRNVYAVLGEDWEAHPLIGQLDTPELAAEAVNAHNAMLAELLVADRAAAEDNDLEGEEMKPVDAATRAAGAAEAEAAPAPVGS